jgi:hypothetical protein
MRGVSCVTLHAAPMKITRVLTDNGKAFTERLFGLRKRPATGQHEFYQLCADFCIEHRLAPPMNGIVEWFNGRIEDVRKAIDSRSARTLSRPFCAMPCSAISSCRSQHWHPGRPCRR